MKKNRAQRQHRAHGFSAMMPKLKRACRRIFPVRPKKAVMCGLPGCVRKTKHNGGYCSAAHCLEHRDLLRASL